MINCKHLTGSPKSCLHLIHDKYDSVLLTNPSYSGKKLRRRNYESAFASNGLDNNGGNLLRIYMGFKKAFKMVKAPNHAIPVIRSARTTVWVSIRHTVYLRCKGTKSQFVVS